MSLQLFPILVLSFGVRVLNIHVDKKLGWNMFWKMKMVWINAFIVCPRSDEYLASRPYFEEIEFVSGVYSHTETEAKNNIVNLTLRKAGYQQISR